jgi:hypothetical protein
MQINDLSFSSDFVELPSVQNCRPQPEQDQKGRFIAGLFRERNHIARAGLNYRFGWFSAPAPVVPVAPAPMVKEVLRPRAENAMIKCSGDPSSSPESSLRARLSAND